jgi:hypothetical protein
LFSSPVERRPGPALALGILSFSIGELCFDFVYRGNPSSVSVCDVFYLAFYPCCGGPAAPVAASRRRHGPRPDRLPVARRRPLLASRRAG